MAAAYAIQNRAADNAVISQGGDGESDDSRSAEGCDLSGVGSECPCRFETAEESVEEEPEELVA
jgi:hypothetical protein